MHTSLTTRIAFSTTLLVLLTVALGTLNVYLTLQDELQASLGERLAGAARLAAALIQGEDVLAVRSNGDVETDAYVRTRDALLEAQNTYELAVPLYTLRASPVQEQVELVVSASVAEPAVGRRMTLRDEMVPALLQGQTTHTGVYANAYGRWISAYATVYTPNRVPAGIVAVDAPIMGYIRALRWRLMRTFMFSASVALLGGALGVIFARNLTRPILKLVDAVRDVQAGDYRVRVPVPGTTEVAALSEAFNEMVQGLRERDRVKRVLGKYIARPVVQKLMEHSDVLRVTGERRQVTVLLTDIRDYTTIAEQLSPEDVVQVLNDYFTVLIDVLFDYEGTIDKFMGDALLAYFGAPQQQEDHRQRALDAAIEIQHRLRTFNRDRAAAGLHTLDTGIGLAVGEVILGNIGSNKRLEFTIIGKAVNLASRLCKQAGGGQVIVSNEVLYGLRDQFDAKRLAPVLVKGFPHPVPVSDLAVPNA